jgi:hypothetical protein
MNYKPLLCKLAFVTLEGEALEANTLEAWIAKCRAKHTKNQDETYSPDALMTDLAENFHTRIMAIIHAHPDSLETEALHPFLNGLPLMGTPQWNTIFFNQNSTTLKTIAELKLSLTRHFVENNIELFNAWKHTQGNDYAIIVPHSLDLCSIGTVGSQTLYSLRDKAFPFSLQHLKTNGIPLSQVVFEEFIRQGERNFSECTLENIDLRTIPEVAQCQFQDTKFSDTTVNVIVFIQLMVQKNNSSALYLRHDSLEVSLSHLSTYTEEQREILLFYAVFCADDQAIRAIMQTGITPHRKEYGVSAIRLAVNNSKWKCVAAFAQRSPNDKNREEYAECLYKMVDKAIESKEQPDDILAAIDALLGVKTPTHFKNSQGNTMLHQLASAQQKPWFNNLIVTLIAAGADAKIQNLKNRTPAQLASDSGNWSATKTAFLSVTNTLDDKLHLGSPLLIAANKGDAEMVREMIVANAAWTWTFLDTANNALHSAALNNHLVIVSWLLRVGFNWKTKNKEGHTACQLAINKKHFACSAVFFKNDMLSFVGIKTDPDEEKLADCLMKGLIEYCNTNPNLHQSKFAQEEKRAILACLKIISALQKEMKENNDDKLVTIAAKHLNQFEEICKTADVNLTNFKKHMEGVVNHARDCPEVRSNRGTFELALA